MNQTRNDEEVARRYLLGALSEAEEEALEREYFADPEKFEQVWAAENELVDNYARGRLSGVDRERFERRYLSSPERRRWVAFAEGLVRVADAEGEEDVPAPRRELAASVPWWRSALGRLRVPAGASAWPFAAVAAAAVLLVAWGVMLLIQKPDLGGRVAGPSAGEVVSNSTPAPPAQPSPSPAPTLMPAALLALNDGGRSVTLDADGNLTGLESLSAPEREKVKKVLTARRVEAPAGLPAKQETLLGGGREGRPFNLVSPVGTGVLSDRPRFEWRPLAGAADYSVKVFDSDFNPVLSSPPLSGVAWEATAPLARGKTYVWQVTARKDGEEIISPTSPAPEARFKVLGQAAAGELARARQRHSGSPLTLGVLYAEAGLLDEAEREFRKLREANPRSPLARQLLGSVVALRR